MATGCWDGCVAWAMPPALSSVACRATGDEDGTPPDGPVGESTVSSAAKSERLTHGWRIASGPPNSGLSRQNLHSPQSSPPYAAADGGRASASWPCTTSLLLEDTQPCSFECPREFETGRPTSSSDKMLSCGAAGRGGRLLQATLDTVRSMTGLGMRRRLAWAPCTHSATVDAGRLSLPPLPRPRFATRDMWVLTDRLWSPVANCAGSTSSSSESLNSSSGIAHEAKDESGCMLHTQRTDSSGAVATWRGGGGKASSKNFRVLARGIGV
eukprot:scaffold40072_cov25-Tisochrysis_lutea.AAC.5